MNISKIPAFKIFLFISYAGIIILMVSIYQLLPVLIQLFTKAQTVILYTIVLHSMHNV